MGSYQIHSGRYKIFQTSDFPLKAQILPLAINTDGCFPESDRLFTSFICKKTSMKYPSLKTIVFLAFILSRKNSIPWQKQLGSARNSNWLRAFPQDHFSMWQKYLIPISHFVTQNIKKIVLSRTRPFPHCNCVTMKTTITTSTAWYLYLDLC